jgi:hypothetical protein
MFRKPSATAKVFPAIDETSMNTTDSRDTTASRIVGPGVEELSDAADASLHPQRQDEEGKTGDVKKKAHVGFANLTAESSAAKPPKNINSSSSFNSTGEQLRASSIIREPHGPRARTEHIQFFLRRMCNNVSCT